MNRELVAAASLLCAISSPSLASPQMEKQTSSQDLQSVPQCRLTAGPEADQHAGDDCAVRLNLDAVLVVAEQMPAALAQPLQER